MSPHFQFCVFWGGENFWKIGQSGSLDTLRDENFDHSFKSLYLTRLRRYKQFCVLLIKKIVNA